MHDLHTRISSSVGYRHEGSYLRMCMSKILHAVKIVGIVVVAGLL